MRLSIFNKSRELIDSVKIEGEIRDKIFLSIDNKTECPECYGRGIIEEDTEEIECVTCDGTGKVNDSIKVCIACDGKKTYIESCTCIMHSIHQGTAEKLENKIMLCSYTLAVLNYLSKKKCVIQVY